MKKNANNVNMKRCLNKTVLNNKEMERNIFQKKIENLNIYNNLFDNSNHKFHRNMKVSASASINIIKKDLFKSNKILYLINIFEG